MPRACVGDVGLGQGGWNAVPESVLSGGAIVDCSGAFDVGMSLKTLYVEAATAAAGSPTGRKTEYSDEVSEGRGDGVL